jgi:hypothetical protein
MEKTHALLDRMRDTLSPNISDFFPNAEDLSYCNWVVFKMVQVNMNMVSFQPYAQQITGIMRMLPKEEMFPFLFIRWCCSMLSRGWQSENMQHSILNLASDLLCLPAAHLFLDDTLFFLKLEGRLERVGRHYRNEELAHELLMEVQLAITRHAENRRAFMDTIHEELIAAAMHPTRIERLIDQYGIEVLESI